MVNGLVKQRRRLWTIRTAGPRLPRPSSTKTRSPLDWLEGAFGFERSMVITDSSGPLGHAELRFGGGTIYIAGSGPTSPRALRLQS